MMVAEDVFIRAVAAQHSTNLCLYALTRFTYLLIYLLIQSGIEPRQHPDLVIQLFCNNNLEQTIRRHSIQLQRIRLQITLKDASV